MIAFEKQKEKDMSPNTTHADPDRRAVDRGGRKARRAVRVEPARPGMSPARERNSVARSDSVSLSYEHFCTDWFVPETHDASGRPRQLATGCTL
jgi:hypothetical protein